MRSGLVGNAPTRQEHGVPAVAINQLINYYISWTVCILVRLMDQFVVYCKLLIVLYSLSYIYLLQKDILSTSEIVYAHKRYRDEQIRKKFYFYSLILCNQIFTPPRLPRPPQHPMRPVNNQNLVAIKGFFQFEKPSF